MFSVSERDRIRDRVLELAASDERVVAGAVVGSMAHDDGDRWSDLDLTFAVAGDRPLMDVLLDWTSRLVAEFDAVRLFDLQSGQSIYRVFLLPGCLQSTSHLLRHHISEQAGQTSDFSSAKPSINPTLNHRRRRNYLVTLSTMHFGRAFVSSAAGTGKRNIGSAAFAITLLASLAAVAIFPLGMVGASMTFRLRCTRP